MHLLTALLWVAPSHAAAAEPPEPVAAREAVAAGGSAATSAPATAADEPTAPERPTADGSAAPEPAAGDPADGDPPIPSTTVTAGHRLPLAPSGLELGPERLGGAPSKGAEELLRQVPGLTVLQHGSEGKGAQFFLRGFDAGHGEALELTLEGIPLNEWSNIHGQGYLDLASIIPEVVQSVQVAKGPFEVEQGPFAIAGTARFRLGIAEEDRGLRATYGVGTTDRHRGLLSYSPSGGDGQDFVAAEVLHDQGFGDNRRIARGAAMAKARLLSFRGGGVGLVGAAHTARFGLPGPLRLDEVAAGRVGRLGTHDPEGRGSSDRWLAGLSLDWAGAGERWEATLYGGGRQLEILENNTFFLHDPLRGDRRLQRHDAHLVGAELRYGKTLARRLRLETGAGGRAEWFRQSQAHVDGDARWLAREHELGGAQTGASARAGLRWRPVDGAELQVGLRGDVAGWRLRSEGAEASTHALAGISPRVAGAWRIAPGWRVAAAYGRGFRPPEARAFPGTGAGRAGVEPALTWVDAAEMGVRMGTERLAVGASGFASWAERELVADHVSGVQIELPRSRRLGVELAAEAAPTGWLRADAAWTWVDARFVDSGGEVPYVPAWVGRAQVSAHLPAGARVGVRWLGFSSRPLPLGARAAPSTWLDAVAGFRWDRFRVDLEVENVLGLELRTSEYFFASQPRPGEGSALPALHSVAGPPRNARLSLTVVL